MIFFLAKYLFINNFLFDDQGILDCLTGPCVTVPGVGKIQGSKKSTQFTVNSPLLDNPSLGQSFTCTILYLDNSLLGQSFTWTILHLDNPLLGQSFTWTILHLDNPLLRQSFT